MSPKRNRRKKINFRKGFYSVNAGITIIGLIIGIACCFQWKKDMISVLEEKPNRAALNKHRNFKSWNSYCIVTQTALVIGYFTRAIIMMNN